MVVEMDPGARRVVRVPARDDGMGSEGGGSAGGSGGFGGGGDARLRTCLGDDGSSAGTRCVGGGRAGGGGE